MFDSYLTELTINHLYIIHIFLTLFKIDSNCNLVRQFLSIIQRFGRAIGQALERTILIVLVCFVLIWCCSCVYNTNKITKVLFTVSVSTIAVVDLLIRILSAPNKILCVPLVTVTVLHTIIYQLTWILSLAT